jgi:hypothetical protein
MTKPELKQVVQYFPAPSDDLLSQLEAPVFALISHIWSDTCVNITIDDPRLPEDAVVVRSSVLFGATTGANYNYCKPSTIDRSADHTLQSDAAIEAEVKAKGLDVAPRITVLQIDDLMARVHYHFEIPTGTTSTFCHAFLDGKFHLGTGHSACVSPENFNAAMGTKMARGKAEQIARDKLWELEGYALFKQLAPVVAGLSLTEARLQVFIDMATLNLEESAAMDKVFAPLLEADQPDRETLLRCVDEVIKLRNAAAPVQHTEDPDHFEG